MLSVQKIVICCVYNKLQRKISYTLQRYKQYPYTPGFTSAKLQLNVLIRIDCQIFQGTLKL